MALAASDPFANTASKDPRTLGCLPLKPEQTQVVFSSVGGDISAVLATGFVLRSPTVALHYINAGGPASTVLALLTHIAAIKYLAGHRGVCVKLLVLCVFHRLQLSRNLRDIPGYLYFLFLVPEGIAETHGRRTTKQRGEKNVDSKLTWVIFLQLQIVS